MNMPKLPHCERMRDLLRRKGVTEAKLRTQRPRQGPVRCRQTGAGHQPQRPDGCQGGDRPRGTGRARAGISRGMPPCSKKEDSSDGPPRRERVVPWRKHPGTESRVKSERVKAAMVILRQQGRHTGGKPPWGYKVVGPRSNPEKGTKGNRRLAPDWEERALMLKIVRLRDLAAHCLLGDDRCSDAADAARSSPGGLRQPRTFPPGVVLEKLSAGPRGLLDRAGEEGRDKLDRRPDRQETGGCPTLAPRSHVGPRAAQAST